jgi:multidrug efflux pump subunit AcrB
VKANSEHLIGRILTYSLSGGLPITFILLSLVLGAIALNFTPREEEPQIVVPMVDVMVESPGLPASQVERQVTIPLEKLLAQIPGVENVYSTSTSGKATVTLRFFVGEDREDAILNTYNKLYSNQDQTPGVVANWQVKPVEVDDVPIVLLALWSDQSELSSDFELRRLADEVSTHLQAIPNTSEVNVTGGRPRTIRILPKPESLAARQSTSRDIVYALQVSNSLQSVGRWSYGNESILLESGDFIRSVDELKQTVINVVDGAPVLLQDVAEIIDGPAEPDNYSWIDFSTNHPAYKEGQDNYSMVTISVAKQSGSNAVRVAEDVHAAIAKLKAELFPAHIHTEVLRDYGATANEKVDDLSSSLAFAVLTVVVFIAIFLGWRPALVVGIAVPISYGVTLALDMAFGYTINRVTLFALILSLGLLVDDPITGVDNIERFLRRKALPGSKEDTLTMSEKIVAAISEIRVPLVMSTITIILAFIPLAFITGMMGPYMAPMAFNVPVSVVTSTVVAFLVTPWLAAKILRPSPPSQVDNERVETESGLLKIYRTLLQPLLNDRRKSKRVLWAVLALFIAAAILPVLRYVPLKLLPFDNKNEVQVIIDMPESATLEHTASTAKQVSNIARRLSEVEAVASYVGQPSPVDFNGMVRHYYHRSAPYLADLRITLIDKALREHQSHGIVLRLRKLLEPLKVDGINLKVVEVPPGPPVLSTLVAEVYGTTFTPYNELRNAAQLIKTRLEREPMVTEVDTSVESDQQRLRFITDKQKAALSGISTDDIRQTLLMAIPGYQLGYLQLEREARPLPLELRLPLLERSSINDLKRLPVKGRAGIVQQQTLNGLEAASQPLVALGELGEFVTLTADKSIQRKDLQPVVYVMAEISGRTPAEVIADVNADLGQPAGKPNDWHARNFLASGAGDGWQLPQDIDVKWSGEGEWKITVDVFRDMGLAFMFALIGIFVVLKLQTASTSLTLIIMSAIPLTIIGIMPGFAILNQFGERHIAGAPDPILFTATAMIGMIALAGIVVRNSLILVEFITQSRQQGMAIKEALIQAGAVRMRPVLLTAGTTMLGNMVIILDPVFSGLALAIMFGIVASTLFTLLIVPVVYMLVFDTENKKVKR